MTPRRQFAFGRDGLSYRVYEVFENRAEPMREVASVWEADDANLITRALNYYYEGIEPPAWMFGNQEVTR